MPGARGDALEWALALARAPAERAVLRQRPLPDGMDSLLQIAIGSRGEALAESIARTGESRDHLVEASRFYLREVLFHPDADAYRILGLERGASTEQLKAHHRWLQQWLHPDRRTGESDAIFAGRVNAAWHQLRDDARRRAYDIENAGASSATAPSVSARPDWIHAEAPLPTSRERWQRRLPVMALVLACAVLGVLALRDIARDEALVSAAVTSGSKEPERTANEVIDIFSGWQIPERAGTAAAMAAHPGTSEPSQRALPHPSQTRARHGGMQPLAPPLATHPADRIVQAPVMPDETRGVGHGERENLPAVSAGDPHGVEPQTPGAAIAAGQPAPRREVVVLPAEIEPAALAPSNASAVVSTGEPAIGSGTAGKARQVGARLLAYLQRRNGPVPPIWDSMSVQQAAARMRGDLAALGAGGIAEPVLRMGENEAQMTAEILYRDGRQGRLDASLVWREQRWLVSRLGMEQGQ